MSVNPRNGAASWIDQPPALYFVARWQFVKIGLSIDPQKRARALGGKLLGFIPDSNIYEEEDIHYRLADARIPAEAVIDRALDDGVPWDRAWSSLGRTEWFDAGAVFDACPWLLADPS